MRETKNEIKDMKVKKSNKKLMKTEKERKD
jgi:hypothetical protein